MFAAISLTDRERVLIPQITTIHGPDKLIESMTDYIYPQHSMPTTVRRYPYCTQDTIYEKAKVRIKLSSIAHVCSRLGPIILPLAYSQPGQPNSSSCLLAIQRT